MNTEKKYTFMPLTLFCIVALFLMTGCAKSGGQKLICLTRQLFVDKNLSIQTRPLHEDEVKNIFGNSFDTKKIIPLQVNLNNPTSESYIFSPRNLNLKTISLNAIGRLLHKNILARVLPLSIASCFFLPLCIPTTILGMRAAHHNEMVDRQLIEWGIDPCDSYIIEPYSTLNRILFIENKNEAENLALEIEQINSPIKHQFCFDIRQKNVATASTTITTFQTL